MLVLVCVNLSSTLTVLHDRLYCIMFIAGELWKGLATWVNQCYYELAHQEMIEDKMHKALVLAGQVSVTILCIKVDLPYSFLGFVSLGPFRCA